MIDSVAVIDLSAVQARHLKSEAGNPALWVDRLAYTEYDGERRPAVWFQACYLQDNLTIQAQRRP